MKESEKIAFDLWPVYKRRPQNHKFQTACLGDLGKGLLGLALRLRIRIGGGGRIGFRKCLIRGRARTMNAGGADIDDAPNARGSGILGQLPRAADVDALVVTNMLRVLMRKGCRSLRRKVNDRVDVAQNHAPVDSGTDSGNRADIHPSNGLGDPGAAGCDRNTNAMPQQDGAQRPADKAGAPGN
jgi:hypothetical protein